MIVPGLPRDTVSGEEVRVALRPGTALEAHAVAVHKLSERLTSIANYLAVGLRLCEIAPTPGIPPLLGEALTKALDQVDQAVIVIHHYRKLLTEESDMESEREQAIRERAYALWEFDGCPNGKDLEFWVRAETEIAGGPHAEVTDNGKLVRDPLQAESMHRATSE